MGNLKTKRDDEPKTAICKDLIVVLDETFNRKTIETVAKNIYALGAEKLYLVDRRDAVTSHLEETICMKKKNPLMDPTIKWSFVKRFTSAEECMDHLKKKKYTSVAISPYVEGKTNVLLHEGDFIQKRLAVWFGKVSDLAIESYEACVSIDMRENHKYLDFDAQIAIVLYEIVKQR